MNKPLTAEQTAAQIDPQRIPYQKPQPQSMRPDMVIHDAMALSGHSDPRVWVPLAEHVAVRPLQFNVTQGQYTHVMRVTKAGMIARHRHSGGVHAWVFKGRWHYLEHDWVAEEGSYIWEPPGGNPHAGGTRRLRGNDHPVSSDRQPDVCRSAGQFNWLRRRVHAAGKITRALHGGGVGRELRGAVDPLGACGAQAGLLLLQGVVVSICFN